MNKPRLEILLSFLETVPDEKFQMNSWVCYLNTCLTAACAGGWACQIPAFQEAGLKLDAGEPSFMVRSALGPRHLHGVSALAEFFGISQFVAQALFHPDFYRIPLSQERVTRDQVCFRLFTLLTSPCP